MVETRIRPARFWYVIGALIIVFGIGGGITTVVVGAVSAARSLATFKTEISSGEPVQVDLDRSGEWGLFAASDSGAGLPDGTCTIWAPDGSTVPAYSPGAQVNFTHGSRQWYWISSFQVTTPGKHAFTCVSPDGNTRFAIGDKPNLGAFGGALAGGIIGLFLGIGLGLVVGITIIVMTAVRRHNAIHRARQASAGGYPGYRGYPGYPGYPPGPTGAGPQPGHPGSPS